MFKGSGWLAAGVTALLVTAGCKQQGKQQPQEFQEAQRAQQQASNQATQAQAEVQQSQQQALDAQRQQQQEQMARTQQRNAQVQGNQQLQQLVTGRVVSASPDELLLSSAGGAGQPQIRLQLNAQTQVLVDGRQASSADIPEGSQVRASYQDVGGEPTALRVDVTSRGSQQGTGGSQEPATQDGQQPPQQSPRGM